MKPRLWSFVFMLIFFLPACTPPKSGGAGAPVEITVSAAVSLRDALNDIQPLFVQAYPAIRLRFNFGSSGALQRQIEQGAPVDLFIAAAPESVTALVRVGLVSPDEVRSLATNRVVLVRGKAVTSDLSTWEQLTSAAVQRIAIGNPEHVPAGQYGRQVLQWLGLWQALQQRLVQAEDVRQVLYYVESGAVQAGIVYATDARLAGVKVVAEAPPGSHEPVTYPMAVLRDSPQAVQARVFADFLASPAGQAVLHQYGFGTAD